MGLIDQRISVTVGRLRSGRRRAGRERVVIIGNGMVCHRLCEALTEVPSPRLAITVLGEERYPAYDRIHLSTTSEAEAAVIAGEAWYEERGIKLRLECIALEIDRARQHVLLATGETVPYDSLVLATGSTPRMPPIPGVDLPNVFSYRTIDDVLRIREALCGAERAAVVGGGLLGLEAARLALDAGCSTHVLEASRLLMPRQLDAQSAAILQQRVERLGVQVSLAAHVRAIEPAGQGGLRLCFEDDSSLEVQIVIVAIGVVPRDELARRAGLRVGARGGVIVDDEMRTSDPRVFAIGDCACHNGRTYGLVAPGFAMADVVASRLRGARGRFAGADSSCELKVLGIPVAAVGNYESDLPAIASTTPDGRRSLLVRRNRIIGAVSVGAWDELARVRALAEREAKVSRRMLERFERTGRLFPQDEPGVASWPAEAVVCNCRRITKGELQAQMKVCGADAGALSRCTGAGGVCGSCKPLLFELVGTSAAAPVRVPYTRSLALLSVVACALALCALLARALPASASVQDDWHTFDLLRQRADYRQITGFSIAGLAVLSLVVSMRKRLNLFARASFGGVRALHGLLGSLAVIALMAHTGLRVGNGLNAALMTCFVMAALAGGIAARAAVAETSLSARTTRIARRLRRPLTLLHILVLWPLPVLLGIHIFAAYYF